MLKNYLWTFYIWKQYSKTPGSFFIVFLFRQIVEILCIVFRPHYIISASFHAFELKVSTQTNFDTLISILKSDSQHDIVMTS